MVGIPFILVLKIFEITYANVIFILDYRTFYYVVIKLSVDMSIPCEIRLSCQHEAVVLFNLIYGFHYDFTITAIFFIEGLTHVRRNWITVIIVYVVNS